MMYEKKNDFPNLICVDSHVTARVNIPHARVKTNPGKKNNIVLRYYLFHMRNCITVFVQI